MSLKLSILSDLPNAEKYLSRLSLKSFVKVSRQAVNKSIMSVRSLANDEARKYRALKKGEINRDYFKLKKARGSSLRKGADISAALVVSGRSMSLLRFVKGPKVPRPQLGISPRKRKKIRVEVTPGKKVSIRGSFIAKGQNGAFHLFMRQGKKRLPLRRLAVTPLSKVLAKEPISQRIMSFARQRLEIEFERAFQLEIEAAALEAMKGK